MKIKDFVNLKENKRNHQFSLDVKKKKMKEFSIDIKDILDSDLIKKIKQFKKG